MVADDVRLSAANPREPRILKPADRRAQLGRHHAGRIRIAEQLAEDVLAGADRTARAFARNAATAQRLVRLGGQPERLRNRDAAAAMRGLNALVEYERFV